MSKVYRGYELAEAVDCGELKLSQRVDSLSLDYKNCTIEFVLKDAAKNVMFLNFELVEDDIDNIEELVKIEEYEVDKTDVVINRNKINELVQAVKQLDKRQRSDKSATNREE